MNWLSMKLPTIYMTSQILLGGCIMFNKQDRITAKAKTKYWGTTHKYGVRITKTVPEYLNLDRQTGQPLWEIL